MAGRHRLPPDQAGVSYQNVRLPAAILAAVGDPERLRVEVHEDGGLYLAESPQGSRITRHRPGASGGMSCAKHRTRLGRRPCRVLDGWLIEVEP